MTGEEYIGRPTSEVPQQEPGEECRAKRWEKRNGEAVFVGYCSQPSGWGTPRESGRCKHHGGNSRRGRDHPAWTHGLYADSLNEEDREVLEAIDGMPSPEILRETISLVTLRIRRAVAELEGEGDDNRGFFDAFEELVSAASEDGIDAEDIGQLAKLLDSSNEALQREISTLRRLVVAHHKVTEGQKIRLDGDISQTIAGEPGGAPITIEWREHPDGSETETDTQ